MRVRQDGNGRGALPTGGDAPDAPRFSVGDTVYSHDCRGTVVSVDIAAGLIKIVWSDGDGGAITYPVDATYLRGRFPWE